MTLAAWPTYDSYKDSGVEWIGELPAHWVVERSKWLFHDRKERARKGEPQLAATQKYGVIPQSEFMELEGRRVTQVFLDFGILKHVESGDFVMSMRSFQGGLEYSDCTGCVSSAYVALAPQAMVHAPFYRYLLKSQRYIEALQATSNLVRDGQALRFENFSMVDLFAPPLPEQRAIAVFLDEKCAKVDEAVRIKEEQIALLRERRQILIQQAVTRGLNPSAPMKDSGIDWIGQIPAHWEVRRFRFLCSITTGGRNTEDKVEDGLYPFFVRSQTAERINTYSFDGEAVLTAGDGAGVGKVYHYYNGKFDFHQRVYKFSDFKEVCGKYAYYYLDANFFNVALLGMAKSTVDSLRRPLIQDFWVAFPPDPIEQESIIDEIELQSSKIEAAISLKEAQIAALKEYKTSLINAAVTGKIKVA